MAYVSAQADYYDRAYQAVEFNAVLDHLSESHGRLCLSKQGWPLLVVNVHL